jgi:hypothetical protein
MFKPNEVNILESLVHEIIHAIITELKIDKIDDTENIVELLGIALSDTLSRNDWIKT